LIHFVKKPVDFANSWAFSVAWQVNIRAVKEKCLQSDRFASIFYLFLLFAVGFGLAQPDLRLKFFGLSVPLFFGLCPPRGASFLRPPV